MSFHWGWASFPGVALFADSGVADFDDDVFLSGARLGASKPGLYAFISPVIAVVIGAWLFGERLDWGDAAGMALMLVALAGLALRRDPSGTLMS